MKIFKFFSSRRKTVFVLEGFIFVKTDKVKDFCSIEKKMRQYV